MSQQAVESFSKINSTLDKIEGEEVTVVAGSNFVVRLVEDVRETVSQVIDVDTGKIVPSYADLLELIKTELQKNPTLVTRDLLSLVQPSCLPCSWFTRK
jgi:hypothetical protein